MKQYYLANQKKTFLKLCYRFGKRDSVYDFINRNSKNDKFNQPGNDEYFRQVQVQQQQPQETQQDEWAEYRRR